MTGFTADQPHIPVLAAEAIKALNVKPDGVYIDGTFGAGGHTRLILSQTGVQGRVLAFDRDERAREFVEPSRSETTTNFELVHASYAQLLSVLKARGISGVDGILFDLGLSSMQLADPQRGFSFSSDGPLDMRFDRSQGRPASALLAALSAEDIADLLFTYGEERQSRKIAAAIVRDRQRKPIETTRQLVDIVSRIVDSRKSRIHPATRTFQALRIAVNDELGELRRGLEAGLDALNPGGRFVVIAFHSLEDRIVKQFFAVEIKGCICPPEIPICVCGRQPTLRRIGKPLRASQSEVQENPRARSAIMRVVERLP